MSTSLGITKLYLLGILMSFLLLANNYKITNIDIKYIIVTSIILLILLVDNISIYFNKFFPEFEFMTPLSNEAVQNISSIYNETNSVMNSLKVSNLEVLETLKVPNLEVLDTIKVGNNVMKWDF